MVVPPERAQDDAATPNAELVKVVTPSPRAPDNNNNSRFARGADRSEAGKAMEFAKGAMMREAAEVHVSRMHSVWECCSRLFV